MKRLGSTVQLAKRRQLLGEVFGYAGLAAVWIVVIGLMYLFRAPLGPALGATIILAVLALIRPHIALGAVIVLGVLGDGVSTPWWPATNNLSSPQSILYVADALTIKPVDIVLVAILATLFVNRFLTPAARPLYWGPLIRPLAVFTATIAAGLIWGLARGGDVRVAYFEASPLLYIPLMYVLATNLFTSLAHYRRLIVAIVMALTIESIYMIATLDEIRLKVGPDQSAFEHSAAVHFNLALLLTIAVGWFGAKRRWPRPLLLLAMVPIVYIYIDGQRRAGIVALIIGMTVLGWILFTRDKQRFSRTIPLLIVAVIAYSTVFWNSSSQLAFPAQAVKSVVQPASAGESDSLSDLYRDFENINLNATIRSNPVLGIGFGNEFLKPIPLPDIGAFFEFADYIPHNIILWIWAKTGIIGFLAFFHSVGLAIAQGVRATVRLTRAVDVAVMSCFVAYVPMAIVVAFVDISIDPTTMTLLGVSMAAAANAEFIQAAERRQSSSDDDTPDSGSVDGQLVSAGVRQ